MKWQDSISHRDLCFKIHVTMAEALAHKYLLAGNHRYSCDYLCPVSTLFPYALVVLKAWWTWQAVWPNSRVSRGLQSCFFSLLSWMRCYGFVFHSIQKLHLQGMFLPCKTGKDLATLTWTRNWRGEEAKLLLLTSQGEMERSLHTQLPHPSLTLHEAGRERDRSVAAAR